MRSAQLKAGNDMDIAGYSPIGWLVFLAFAVFCGATVFYVVYGAFYTFESDEGPKEASTWLINHQKPIIAVLSVISVIVIIVASTRSQG